MRGRKPKPSRLHVINGNPSKLRLNDAEPRPPVAVPSCPPHLSAEAKKEWRRVVKELAAVGLLTKLDRAALACYCQSWADWAAACAQVAQFGTVLVAEGGRIYVNPQVHVANRALAALRSFASEFGMTPSARTRLHVAPPSHESEFEAFLGQKKSG